MFFVADARVRPKLEVQMLISHKGKKPEVHSSAYIAPTATICGDVTIGPNCRVMHGASTDRKKMRPLTVG